MQELINQLNEPDIHFPGNFCTPKQANALLMCLCQEAAEAIKTQAAERDALKAALEKLACLGNGDSYGNSVGNCIAQEALKGLK